MVCVDVFKKIDELNDTYLDVWEKACTIESPTNYKAGVDEVGRFFAGMAKERGWEVEYSRQDVSGDVVCITMNPNVDAAPLCVSGHIPEFSECPGSKRYSVFGASAYSKT